MKTKDSNLDWYVKHLDHVLYSIDSFRAAADAARVKAKHTPWGTGKRLELLNDRREYLVHAWEMRKAARYYRAKIAELIHA